MSNWLTNLVGSGAGSLEYYFGGGPALQSRSNKLDQQLTVINQQDYAPGGALYNEIAATQGQAAADTAWQQVQANLASSPVEVRGQLESAGKTGAAAGLNNLAGGIQGFFNGIFSTAFKLMPWQGWLAIAAGLLLYFGGLKWLKRSLA